MSKKRCKDCIFYAFGKTYPRDKITTICKKRPKGEFFYHRDPYDKGCEKYKTIFD